MFRADNPEHVANQEKQRDYMLEKIMMLTNDTAGKGHHLTDEDVASTRNGGFNEYIHKSEGKRFPEKFTQIMHKWGWYRDRLFWFLNKHNLYQHGIQEEIHPDLRWDPDDPTSADYWKLGQEFYTQEVKRNRNPDKGPRAGMITFQKVQSEEYRDLQRVLRCLKKAYNMQLGEFEVITDAPNASVIIKEAVQDEVSGYIAWVGVNEGANKMGIMLSDSLGGDVKGVKKYFDAYMRFESFGCPFGPNGEGYGPVRHHTEAYRAELIYLNEMGRWMDEQQDNMLAVDRNPDSNKLNMKGKGKPPKGKSKGKMANEFHDPWGFTKQEQQGKGQEMGKNTLTQVNWNKVVPFGYAFEWFLVKDHISDRQKTQGEIYQNKATWFDMYNAWIKENIKDIEQTHAGEYDWTFGYETQWQTGHA